jgi:hypothetical protein
VDNNITKENKTKHDWTSFINIYIYIYNRQCLSSFCFHIFYFIFAFVQKVVRVDKVDWSRKDIIFFNYVCSDDADQRTKKKKKKNAGASGSRIQNSFIITISRRLRVSLPLFSWASNAQFNKIHLCLTFLCLPLLLLFRQALLQLH